MLEDCICVLRFKATEKQIELTVIESDALNRTIVTDENRVKQIIINLLSNAIKYT